MTTGSRRRRSVDLDLADRRGAEPSGDELVERRHGAGLEAEPRRVLHGAADDVARRRRDGDEQPARAGHPGDLRELARGYRGPCAAASTWFRLRRSSSRHPTTRIPSPSCAAPIVRRTVAPTSPGAIDQRRHAVRPRRRRRRRSGSPGRQPFHSVDARIRNRTRPSRRGSTVPRGRRTSAGSAERGCRSADPERDQDPVEDDDADDRPDHDTRRCGRARRRSRMPMPASTGQPRMFTGGRTSSGNSAAGK